MHYIGFPSALLSPCLRTFSHWHLRLATWSTFPTLCTHWRFRPIEKNCRAPFHSFSSWTKSTCLWQSCGFPSFQGPCRTQIKTYIFSQPLLWYLQHNLKSPERNLAKWDVNITEYFLLWRHVAKSCTFYHHDWEWCVSKRNMEILALNFPFLAAHHKCKLDLSF